MRQGESSGTRALLSGATGLIGAKLAGRLADAVVLSRDPERARHKLGAGEAHAWSPEEGPPPAAALAKLDAVFHLAGEPVAEGRWTAERKRRIHDSRVLGTRHLVAGLAAQASRPRVRVCASAVG
jgi:NAD dependent epimerase/dehydratase family enzyme